MLDVLAEWVKLYALPGSPWLLLGGATAAAALVSARRTRLWGIRLLVILVTAYWLLASPWFAGALHSGLSAGFEPLRSDPGGVGTVVVLGGGAETHRLGRASITSLSEASAERVLEAARLYPLLRPEWVIASGGGSESGDTPESSRMADALQNLGVPQAAILEEDKSGDTFEQAVQLGQILRERDIGAFVLVTSPAHMRRAIAVFRAQGWDPVASPGGPADRDQPEGLRAFLPSTRALRTSELASREYLALFYYWVRGRIERPWGVTAGAN